MKRPLLSADPGASLMEGKFRPLKEAANAAMLAGEEDHFLRLPTRRGSPEATIQRAIIDRLRWHGILCVHIPNEGKRSAIAGRRLKADGMRPGWPDLACYQDARHALLEVKAPNGRLSPAQQECHAVLARHGFVVAVVTSQDQAVAALREAGFRC